MNRHLYIIKLLLMAFLFSCSEAEFEGLGSSDKPPANNDLRPGHPDQPFRGEADNSGMGSFGSDQFGDAYDNGESGTQNGSYDSKLYGGDGSRKLDPCVPVESGGSLVNFEDVISKHGLAHGARVTNQYENDLGVKFSFVGGGAPIIANVGPPETAFFCDNCSMTQDGVKPGVPVGVYFLTDDGIVGGNGPATNKQLKVEYSEPSDELSFDLLDLDGNEAWHAKAYSEDDQIVAQKVVRSRSFLYKNGDIETIVLKSTERNIVKLILSPVSGVGNFGVAFDNFRPHGACN